MRSLHPIRIIAFAAGVLLLLPARAHDPEASWTTARLRPDALELEINFAAVSAWTLVEETLAPGLVFVYEDFDAVARPLLLRIARTLQEVTLDGKVITPSRVEVVMVNDDFDFTLVFPLPVEGGRMLRIREKYLAAISPQYQSNVNVLDAHGERITAKVLDADDASVFIALRAGGQDLPANPKS